MSDDVTIGAVEFGELAQVLEFVAKARFELFPKLRDADVPDDLQRFEQVYLRGEGRFLVARAGGRIVGSIGYVPYDGRFAQFDYSASKVVEVVRLFVSPDLRRIGLAGRLYQALRREAQAAGVQVLYLHTHPFLPGAVEFWQRQGFGVLEVEDDAVWRTTHMECGCGGSQCAVT